MKSLLIILSLILCSCSSKIIPGKYGVIKEINQVNDNYVVVVQLQNGQFLYNEQPLVNFAPKDTVYWKIIKTESEDRLRLFKL